MFAAPWFWLIWFVSIILLFVTLLLNSHGSSHYLSVTSHTSSFCASGCNCSASHSEQHEGVVNISLNYFVRIKSWLIVNTFSKYFCAYLQGFLFPKSPFLPPPLPTSSPSRFLNPSNFFHFPTTWKITDSPVRGNAPITNWTQTQPKWLWRVNNCVKIRSKKIKLKYIY